MQQGDATVKLNISQAAKSAGVDRSTIQRKIKSGKLSATVDMEGNKLILDDQVFSDCNLASLIFKALHSSEIHL